MNTAGASGEGAMDQYAGLGIAAVTTTITSLG